MHGEILRDVLSGSGRIPTFTFPPGTENNWEYFKTIGEVLGGSRGATREYAETPRELDHRPIRDVSKYVFFWILVNPIRFRIC